MALSANERALARSAALEQLDAADRAAVEAMPKVELHVHLEGSIRPATMLSLAERNRVHIGADDEGSLRARYSFETFDQFASLYMLGISVLRMGEDFELVIEQLTSELLDQNVLHAEVTTSPWTHLHRGVAEADYTAALDAGRMAAAKRGLSIVWINDIPRGFENPPYDITMDYVLGPHAPEGLVAFGLGGTEIGYPPREFASCFDRALAAGLHSDPHAGETEGPASVRAALDLLHAERIGHGVRAIEDDALTRELAERQVPLEICPTSNVALKVAPDYQHHPLARMLEAGLNVSINSDDPAYFSTTLTQELLVAIVYGGCSVDDVVEMQRRAAQAAFVSEHERAELLGRLD